MMTPILFTLAVAVAAPAPKDVPKHSTSLEGEWAAQKYIEAGRERTRPVTMTFTADGKFLLREGIRAGPEEGSYKAARKKDPAEIDLLPPAGRSAPPVLGIYKVEGDTLTLCVAKGGPDARRPPKFESMDGAQVTLFVLRRASKKD